MRDELVAALESNRAPHVYAMLSGLLESIASSGGDVEVQHLKGRATEAAQLEPKAHKRPLRADRSELGKRGQHTMQRLDSHTVADEGIHRPIVGG